MKKILFFFVIALSLASCSDSDEPVYNATDKQAEEIATVLNGTFVATIDDLAGTKTHEITFTPYEVPKEMEFTIPGEYVNLERKVKVYGECHVSEYYNDHLLQTDDDWRYIINIAYEGAQPELWLYPIGVYGRYETHDITIINKTSFILDKVNYNKQ